MVSSIFLDHSAMRLDINCKKKSVRNTDTWRLNDTFLNNQEVTEEIKREIKKFLETNDNENTTTQNLRDTAKAVLRGKFIATQSYLKEQDKHLIQPNFTPKATGKRISLKNQKKERNHKDPSRNKGKRNERNKSKD